MCGARHHSLLRVFSTPAVQSTSLPAASPTPAVTLPAVLTPVLRVRDNTGTALMESAMIKVSAGDRCKLARALLDCGASVTLVSRSSQPCTNQETF